MATEIYKTEEWNGYAYCHASVFSSFQFELFRETAKHLQGDIVDCGCGSSRLAPFLADQVKVSSYTGVDAAEEMVEVARDLIAQLSDDRFKIVHCKIEDVHQKFTSAVSIHSYYSWPKPEVVLRQIYELLLPDSLFVLATPNASLDMPRLLKEAEKELICHPHYSDFKRFNMQFANNPQARFISMDRLVKQVQDVGFKVQECNQKHYLGGVNLLLLKKA